MREVIKVLLIIVISYLVAKEQGLGCGMALCFILIGINNRQND